MGEGVFVDDNARNRQNRGRAGFPGPRLEGAVPGRHEGPCPHSVRGPRVEEDLFNHAAHFAEPDARAGAPSVGYRLPCGYPVAPPCGGLRPCVHLTAACVHGMKRVHI